MLDVLARLQDINERGTSRALLPTAAAHRPPLLAWQAVEGLQITDGLSLCDLNL